jgi:hypothetical protein
MTAHDEAAAVAAPPPNVSAASGFAFGFAFMTVLFAVWTFLTASHDQSFGPLSMETGKNVALALWVAAPIVGGVFGRRAANGGLRNAALLLGIVVGLVLALFPTSGTGDYLCSLVLPTGPISYLLGRLAVGALVGGGMALALVVAGIGTRRGITAVPAIVLAAAINYACSAAAYTLFYEGVRCL